jgi:hypothetical protein
MKTKLTALKQKAKRLLGGQILKFGLAVGVAALLAIGGLALLVNIMDHKQEAKNPFFRAVDGWDAVIIWSDPLITKSTLALT